MYSVDNVMDSLKQLDIHEADLVNWEHELGLAIPVDDFGRKQYSSHHVNIFKNIQKHLAKGRTLDEIRDLLELPSFDMSSPQGENYTVASIADVTVDKKGTVNPAIEKSEKVSANSIKNKKVSEVVSLINKLSGEKDYLYRKLLESEKLNSHLYSANTMFHRKVKEMLSTIKALKGQLKDDHNLRLMEEKSKLAGQLIAAEKELQHKEKDNVRLEEELERLAMKVERLENVEKDLQAAHHRVESLDADMADADNIIQDLEALLKEKEFALGELKASIHTMEQEAETSQEDIEFYRAENEKLTHELEALNARFTAKNFCGDWMEESRLIDVVYDNFGIQVDPKRTRMFRIGSTPERVFGKTAIISTCYEYETNRMWKREETMTVTYMDNGMLNGELAIEYILDGVPVAKALYNLRCIKNKADKK